MDNIFELPDRTFIGGKETALSLRLVIYINILKIFKVKIFTEIFMKNTWLSRLDGLQKTGVSMLRGVFNAQSGLTI